MVNVLLPFYTTFCVLGSTVNLINYDVKVPPRALPIFNNTDIVKNHTKTLTTAYHVTPGDDFPPSVFDLPVDAGLRYLFGEFPIMLPTLHVRDVDSVTILITARYVTEEQSLKKDASPVPDWKNIAQNHTHYVDKFLYGVSCYGIFRVESNVTGDVQILQKIITDVMGTSGQVTNDTINLWHKARKAYQENTDIRGTIKEGFSVVSFNGNLKLPGGNDIDSFLRIVPDIPKLVPWTEYPSLVSYKALHDLDKQFPALEKNLKTVEYLGKLEYRTNDLKSTLSLYRTLFDDRHTGLQNETLNKLKEFNTTASINFEALRKLAAANHSIYSELEDKEAFQKAFDLYEKGLDKTTRSYYVALKKLYEDLVVRCENDFLAPTSGYLEVGKHEIVSKTFLFGNLTKCQEYCEEDERCRAFGYLDIDVSHATIFSGKGQLCTIFYRSTNTATLIHPKSIFEGVQTYDRKCHYEWIDK